MSPLRYKTLLTYLPGMASVVNAFDSPQVQNSVYEVLMDALDSKLDTEGLGRGTSEDRPPLNHVMPASNGELAHELVEGESIHADQPRKLMKSASTVF
jgi:hypothetical protein